LGKGAEGKVEAWEVDVAIPNYYMKPGTGKKKN